MNNPSGTTHDRSITDKSLHKEQMAIMNDLKELLTDTGNNNRKAFKVCPSDESLDGQHDYYPVTDKTIKAPTKSGGCVMVSHFIIDGYTHYREKCSSCGKVRMACK